MRKNTYLCTQYFAPEKGMRTLDSKLCNFSLNCVFVYIALAKNVLDFAIILKRLIVICTLVFDFQFSDDTCRFKVNIGLNYSNLET